MSHMAWWRRSSAETTRKQRRQTTQSLGRPPTATWTKTEVPVPCEKYYPKGTFQKRSVGEWEKRFGMTWKTFLSFKKRIAAQGFDDHYYKVMKKWDDSEAKDAFQRAERQFWSSKNADDHGPKYVEQVDWEAGIDEELEKDWEETRRREKEGWMEKGWEEIRVLMGRRVDIDAGPRVLTGMIVGT